MIMSNLDVLSLENDISKLVDLINQFLSLLPEKYSHIESFKKTMKRIKLAQTEFNKIKDLSCSNFSVCSFIGRASSGKSSLLNCLLEDDILPTSFGRTTPCNIAIRQSSKSETYIERENNEYKSNIRDNLKSLMKDKKNMAVIKLYINVTSKSVMELLTKRVMLCDTPGTDIDEEKDRYIKKSCMGSHVVVWTVNGQQGLCKSESEYLTKYKTDFSKLNVFIVYTFWDMISHDPDHHNIRNDYVERARSMLMNTIGMEEGLAEKRIYFISPKEFSNKNLTNPGRVGRDDEFERLKKDLVAALTTPKNCKGEMKSIYKIVSTEFSQTFELFSSRLPIPEHMRPGFKMSIVKSVLTTSFNEASKLFMLCCAAVVNAFKWLESNKKRFSVGNDKKLQLEVVNKIHVDSLVDLTKEDSLVGQLNRVIDFCLELTLSHSGLLLKGAMKNKIKLASSDIVNKDMIVELRKLKEGTICTERKWSDSDLDELINSFKLSKDSSAIVAFPFILAVANYPSQPSVIMTTDEIKSHESNLIVTNADETVSGTCLCFKGDEPTDKEHVEKFWNNFSADWINSVSEGASNLQTIVELIEDCRRKLK